MTHRRIYEQVVDTLNELDKLNEASYTCSLVVTMSTTRVNGETVVFVVAHEQLLSVSESGVTTKDLSVPVDKFIRNILGEEPLPTTLAYTTAQECYDGFGTITGKVIGKYFSDDVREVEILNRHLDWQLNRYRSGMNLASVSRSEIEYFMKGVENESNE